MPRGETGETMGVRGKQIKKILLLATLAAFALPEARAGEASDSASNAILAPAQNQALPPVVLPTAPETGISPLRNIDLLNKMEDERLPTSPRHFLKVRFKQVRKAKDQKILQLLLVCVGFVGAFVAILALRSVPPSRPQSN
jgi:hypothetical protein